MTRKPAIPLAPATPRTSGRRGAILLVAIVCVALCSALCVSLARLAVLQQRQTDLASRQLKADWLARSAIGRATARLAVDDDYAGETWRVAAEELGDHASVLIRVTPAAEQENTLLIHVVADYPDDPQFRARRTLQTRISK